jgi:hypothetical protein
MRTQPDTGHVEDQLVINLPAGVIQKCLSVARLGQISENVCVGLNIPRPSSFYITPKFNECYRNTKSDDDYSECFKIVANASSTPILPLPIMQCVTGAKSNSDIDICSRIRTLGSPITSVQFIAIFTGSTYVLARTCYEKDHTYSKTDVDSLRQYAAKRLASVSLPITMLDTLDTKQVGQEITEDSCKNKVGKLITAMFPPNIFSQSSELTTSSAESSTANLSTLTLIFGVYSVVKLCSDNHIIYDEAKVNALKSWIGKYVDGNKINTSDKDRAWDLSRQVIDKGIKPDTCSEIIILPRYFLRIYSKIPVKKTRFRYVVFSWPFSIAFKVA